nr:aldo/keto reductase [uncultured Devosia sp.]
MDRNTALNDGRTMPKVGFGVWQIGDRQAETLVSQAIDAGFRHLDTAQAYGNEGGVGRAVVEAEVDRGELFVTSKLRGRDMGYDNALRSFDASLKRLGLDYLDLFLIHWPMPATSQYVETWEALVDLRKSGRVRSIGVSNFTAAHVDHIVGKTGVVPAINQLELHPFFQERAIREHHLRHAITIQSYSPLGSNGGRVLRNPVVMAIAERHGRTPAQVVIRWHLQQGLVPLPKTATPSRIPENLAVWDFVLKDEEMVELRALDQRHGNTQPLPDEWNSPF